MSIILSEHRIHFLNNYFEYYKVTNLFLIFNLKASFDHLKILIVYYFFYII